MPSCTATYHYIQSANDEEWERAQRDRIQQIYDLLYRDDKTKVDKKVDKGKKIEYIF